MRARWMQTALMLMCGAIVTRAYAADVELRIFDASELIKNPTDYPAPDLSLHSSASIMVDPLAGPPPESGLRVPDLVTLFHDRLFPADFADQSTSIAENNGALVIMAPPATGTKIEHYLTTLHGLTKSQLVMKGLLVQSARIPDATVFDAEALKKIQGDPAAAATRAAPRLLCYNAQIAHVESGRNFNFIRDYDVAGSIYDPVVATAHEGFVFEVRPTLAGDRTQVTASIRFTYTSAAGKPETREIVMASPARPNADAAAPAAPAPTLKIDVPSLDTQHISTEVRIPVGKWVLAGVMNNTVPESKEKYLLFFVSADEAR